MANRPDQLCHIEKGKTMSAQEYFADTFNWGFAWIDNLKGEGEEEAKESEEPDGLYIDRKVDDHPVIRGGKIRITDNQDEPVTVRTRDIRLMSGDSSNVKFILTNGDDGKLTVKVDVFYV